jgi:8-amino-7-oxononanoate synthase
VSGAFAAGPAWAIEYLVQRARPFIFSTAAPPAVASAIEASLDIVSAEPERRESVMRRSATIRRALQAAGFAVPDDESPIVPILIGENERASQVAAALQAAGFDIRAIRPPTVPPGTARLRLSVHATLDEGIIDRFVRALADALQGATPWSAVSS